MDTNCDSVPSSQVNRCVMADPLEAAVHADKQVPSDLSERIKPEAFCDLEQTFMVCMPTMPYQQCPYHLLMIWV